MFICKCNKIFDDFSFNLTYKRNYNRAKYFSRKFFLTKTDYFSTFGRKFSHLVEMNITFFTDLRNMTYKHYLKQPKSMLEWKLNENSAENLEPIRIFDENASPPIILKKNRIDQGENQDLLQFILNSLF